MPCTKRVSVVSATLRRHRHRRHHWLQSMSYNPHIDSFYLCRRHKVHCQSSRFQVNPHLCHSTFGPIPSFCSGSLGFEPRYLQMKKEMKRLTHMWHCGINIVNRIENVFDAMAGALGAVAIVVKRKQTIALFCVKYNMRPSNFIIFESNVSTREFFQFISN